MPYPGGLCPTPEWCIQNFLEDIALSEPPASSPAAAAMSAWLRDLQSDHGALAALDRARRAGLDVPRLLYAAAFYLFDRAWMDGPIGRIRIELPEGGAAVVQDINEALAQAEAHERTLQVRSSAADEFRRIKSLLDELNAEIRRDAAQVRHSTVPDGRGGFAERAWIATGSAVAVTTGEIALAQGSLAKMRGSPGEHALDVTLIVIVGHMKAVASRVKPALVVDLMLRGLKLGMSVGAGDPDAAMRRRFYRCRSSKARPDHWKRARIIAGIVHIAFTPA